MSQQKNSFFYSLLLYNFDTDASIRSKRNGKCSVAVVLLNRGETNVSIVVHWTDAGLPSEDLAIVRDLWTRKNIGSFRHNYASPSIEPHRVMMLNISLL